MCMINNAKDCATNLRRVADLIEKRAAERENSPEDLCEQMIANGERDAIVAAANDLLGIVQVEEIGWAMGTYINATDFDWDAFFHSVVLGGSHGWENNQEVTNDQLANA